MNENDITYKDLGGNPTSDWKVVVNKYMLVEKNGDVKSKAIPVQTDGINCGIFMLHLAESLSLNSDPCIMQMDVNNLRERMAMNMIRMFGLTGHDENISDLKCGGVKRKREMVVDENDAKDGNNTTIENQKISFDGKTYHERAPNVAVASIRDLPSIPRIKVNDSTNKVNSLYPSTVVDKAEKILILMWNALRNLNLYNNSVHIKRVGKELKLSQMIKTKRTIQTYYQRM